MILATRHSTLITSQTTRSSLHSVLRECACFTSLEKLRPVKMAEEFDQLCDDTGPACLVAGAKARAIVAMEIFVEGLLLYSNFTRLR